MTYRISIAILVSAFLISVTACGQDKSKKAEASEVKESKEPHRYGGWYCPDNFGFVPVDVQHLDKVPAIANRLPTEEELNKNMSLIRVDTEKYPDARALKMDLPRVASVYSPQKRMNELIIVIQAIVVQEDTVVGYRFANGGNGSGWISDVTFLSDDEVAEMGAQPFFYSKSTLKANTSEIWAAMGKTDYFNKLGEKFGEKFFFSTVWNPEASRHLEIETENEMATGYVGMVFGNYYLHIDYERDGFHYSEKILMLENAEEGTTDFHVATGPYPEGYDQSETIWSQWVKTVTKNSESN